MRIPRWAKPASILDPISPPAAVEIISGHSHRVAFKFETGERSPEEDIKHEAEWNHSAESE